MRGKFNLKRRRYKLYTKASISSLNNIKHKTERKQK